MKIKTGTSCDSQHVAQHHRAKRWGLFISTFVHQWPIEPVSLQWIIAHFAISSLKPVNSFDLVRGTHEKLIEWSSEWSREDYARFAILNNWEEHLYEIDYLFFNRDWCDVNWIRLGSFLRNIWATTITSGLREKYNWKINQWIIRVNAK